MGYLRYSFIAHHGYAAELIDLLLTVFMLIYIIVYVILLYIWGVNDRHKKNKKVFREIQKGL